MIFSPNLRGVPFSVSRAAAWRPGCRRRSAPVRAPRPWPKKSARSRGPARGRRPPAVCAVKAVARLTQLFGHRPAPPNSVNCAVKGLHRGGDHAFLIGQRELGALVERGLPAPCRPGSGRAPSTTASKSALSAASASDAPHRSAARPARGGAVVFQQFVVGGQARVAAAPTTGALRSKAANQLWKVRICTGRPAASMERYRLDSDSRTAVRGLAAPGAAGPSTPRISSSRSGVACANSASHSCRRWRISPAAFFGKGDGQDFMRDLLPGRGRRAGRARCARPASRSCRRRRRPPPRRCVRGSQAIA